MGEGYTEQELRDRVIRRCSLAIAMLEDWLNGDSYRIDGRGMYKRLLETAYDASDTEISEIVKHHPDLFENL